MVRVEQRDRAVTQSSFEALTIPDLDGINRYGLLQVDFPPRVAAAIVACMSLAIFGPIAMLIAIDGSLGASIVNRYWTA